MAAFKGRLWVNGLLSLKGIISLFIFTVLCLLLFLPQSAVAARVAGEDKPVVTSEPQKAASPITEPFVQPGEKKYLSAGKESLPEKTTQETKTRPVAVPKLPAGSSGGPAPKGTDTKIIYPPPSHPKGVLSEEVQKKPVVVTPPVTGPAFGQRKIEVVPPAPAPSPIVRAVPDKVTPPQEQPPIVRPQVPTTSPAAAPARDTRYVTIDFDNVDIQVFVKFISELTGKNFIIDEKVKGKVTIISPKKIAVDDVYQVFESVLEVYGFATVTSGDVIKVVPAIDARGKKVETLLDEDKVTAEDKIVTQIISLAHANTDEMKKVLDPLISKTSVILSYPPTGMLIVTDVASNINRLQTIVDALDVEGVGEQISYIPLQFASASDSVKSLTTVFQQQQRSIAPIRIVADERTNSLIIMASEVDTDHIKDLIKLMDKEIPKAGTLLHIYRLQNASAEDMAKVLMNIPKDSKDPAQKGKSPVISKDVSIISDKATNTLVITAERSDYLILEDVIKKLDTPRPMVYIEALIMEVSVNKDFKIGVEWRGLRDSGHVSGTDTGRTAAFIGSGGAGTSGGYNIIPGTDVTTGSVSFPGGFSLGILGAGITIGGVVFPNIGAVLQAYQSDQDVSILSTPQLLTIDNEDAEINVGENRPYLTRRESSTVTTSIDYSSYEYKDVGVTLKINPHINEENFVRLKLDQQVTRVVSGGEASLPVTRKRTAKTTVVVKDGETVVIGGLVGDTTDVTTYKVPCLGNIPLFGWLFKSMARGKEKSNLFVFITPHIIRTHKEAAEISNKKRDVMGEIEEGVIKMNEKKPVKPVKKEK